VFVPEATKKLRSLAMPKASSPRHGPRFPVTPSAYCCRAEIRTFLKDAAEKAGIRTASLASLIRVYSHEIDFQRDIHPGDRFEILYDQPMTKYGKAVGEGSIIYATNVCRPQSEACLSRNLQRQHGRLF